MNINLKDPMHPIIIPAENINAVENNGKTTLQYLIKPQPHGTRPQGLYTGTHKEYHGDIVFEYDNCVESEIIKVPYYKDDILFAKEAWMIQSMSNYDKTAKILFKNGNRNLVKVQLTAELYNRFLKYSNKRGWLSPVFMPREIARYVLRVTDVRAERLQAITELDSSNEVMFAYDLSKRRACYAQYWDRKHQYEDLSLYGWDANPFVIVIDFQKQEIFKTASTPTMAADTSMKIA